MELFTVRSLRLKKGWSQNELAYRAGVSYNTVSRLENGHVVNRGMARLICEALGVSPDQVTGIHYQNVVNRRAK